MSVFKKYALYKRLLLATFAVNVFFIVCGVVALVRFFQTHEATTLEIAAVGLGTLIFGVVTPIYVLNRFFRVIDEMRKQTEQNVARWVAGWIESYGEHDGALQDPRFWINIALLTVEVVGGNFKHPAARYVAEFAPLIKDELAKQRPPKKRKNRNSDRARNAERERQDEKVAELRRHGHKD